jgi:3-phenylpropionate/trans-cinnamate dioxygenase ferredoxin subunit
LQQYWLDNKAAMLVGNQPAPFPDPVMAGMAPRFFPGAVQEPLAWNFDEYQPVFLALCFKIDRALTEGAPRVRGMYQKEKADILRRTRLATAERTERRASHAIRPGDSEVWRRAVRLGHLSSGEMTDVEIGGRHVVVANVDGEYFALDGICTHVPRLSALTNLSNGRLDSENYCLSCPWHGATYSLRTGQVERQPYPEEFRQEHLVRGRLLGAVDPNKETTALRAYRTKVENGYIWVNLV